MIFLQKDRFPACLEFLKKAQILASGSKFHKALTYNNLACHYRRVGKLKQALKYLQLALVLQVKLKNAKTLADTHLNVCAVLSQLNRHEEALEHVLISVVLL
jgi:tetratricopeptide (TPR) repeat protein